MRARLSSLIAKPTIPTSPPLLRISAMPISRFARWRSRSSLEADHGGRA